MALPISFEHTTVRQTSDRAVTVRMDEPNVLPERPVADFRPEQEVAFETIRKTMARRKRSK